MESLHSLDKSGRKATSIKIKPDVWKKAKLEAIKRDMHVSLLVEKSILFWINGKK